MRQIIMLKVLLAISTLGAGAQSLTDLLETAVQSDPGVAVAKRTLEQRLIQAELDDPESFLSFEAGTGTVTYSQADNPRAGRPENTLDVEPTVAVTLATPLGTTLSLSVPATLDLDSGAWDQITPTASLIQPLNEILGLVDDTHEELTELYQITDAQLNLSAELVAVESAVLTAIRDVIALESQIGEAQQDLSEVRTDLNEARVLSTYDQDSSQYALLVATAERAARQVDYLRASEERALDSLHRVVGLPVAELPRELPDTDLRLPKPEEANNNPGVYLTRMALTVEKAELEDQIDPDPPELSLAGTYKRAIEEKITGEETTTNTAGVLQVAFDQLSFGAGVGGISETGSLYFTTELNWSPSNVRQDSLTEQSLLADIHIAEAEMEQAYQDYLNDRDTLALEIIDLERREEDLEMDRIATELALAETLSRHQGGLADDEELAQARWQTEEIAYDDRLLALDRLIAQVQLRGLTMDKVEEQR